MEIRLMRERTYSSPPPPPSNANIRDWFAGLALANPELMKDVPTELKAKEAVRLADEMMLALASPRVPTVESMRAPTPKEMHDWEAHVSSQRDLRTKDTCPRGLRHPTLPPPPLNISVRRSPPPINTRYSSIKGNDILTIEEE